MEPLRIEYFDSGSSDKALEDEPRRTALIRTHDRVEFEKLLTSGRKAIVRLSRLDTGTAEWLETLTGTGAELQVLVPVRSAPPHLLSLLLESGIRGLLSDDDAGFRSHRPGLLGRRSGNPRWRSRVLRRRSRLLVSVLRWKRACRELVLRVHVLIRPSLGSRVRLVRPHAGRRERASWMATIWLVGCFCSVALPSPVLGQACTDLAEYDREMAMSGRRSGRVPLPAGFHGLQQGGELTRDRITGDIAWVGPITIRRIFCDSPAHEAGLRVGDVLLAVNGVDPREPRVLYPHRAGMDFEIVVQRGDEQIEYSLTTVSRPGT